MPIRDRMTYVALKIFPRRAKSSRIEKGSNGMSLGGRGAIAENVESGLACLLANRGIGTEGAGRLGADSTMRRRPGRDLAL